MRMCAPRPRRVRAAPPHAINLCLEPLSRNHNPPPKKTPLGLPPPRNKNFRGNPSPGGDAKVNFFCFCKKKEKKEKREFSFFLTFGDGVFPTPHPTRPGGVFVFELRPRNSLAASLESKLFPERGVETMTGGLVH